MSNINMKETTKKIITIAILIMMSIFIIKNWMV